MTRAAVRAARLHALGLAERRADADAAPAAAPGLRDTPAGVFRDALAARLAPPAPPAPPAAPASSGRSTAQGTVDRPLDAQEAGLVAIWGPRAAPYVVAAADLGVFTRGAFPVDEASARAFAPSATKALDPRGVELLDAFARVEQAMRAAVAGGPVGRDDMHQQLREALPDELLWWCRGCGSHHVHPMVWRAACAMGGLRREEDASSRAVTYAAVTRPPEPGQDARARRELTRRALHHHGPLTPAELAAWLGVSKPDARARLEALAPELEEVDRDGRAAWALRADLELLAEAPAVRGVRLLGAGDPLLDGRDRASVVPDPAHAKEVWKVLANPGVVLGDGRVLGTWRARVARGRLEVTVRALGGARLPAAGRLAPEAAALAAGRGLDAAILTRA